MIKTYKTPEEFDVFIDEVVTDLNNKADIDLINTNPSSSFASALNTAGIRTIVETYQNGTSWYRVYSDGWCEQGGHATSQGAVTLLKPFLNMNYNVCCGNSFSTASTNTNSLLWSKEDTSSIYFASYPSWGEDGADWQASGYIS